MKGLKKKIRKVILEFLENTNQNYEKSLLKDIHYLKDFHLHHKSSAGNYDYWIFYFDTHGGGYKIICAITKDKTTDAWSLKSEVYWIEFDRRKTPGTGMEYTIDIDNVVGYKEFVNEVNRKLHNNPLMNSDLYHDDYNFMMTKEIVKELISLIVNYPKIESLQNSQQYEPLKKFYNDTKDLSVEETIDYIQDNYPADGDKQMLIYQLNALDNLKNFMEIEKMSVTPESETIG